jgi:SOS-response transcriptional repressor LexA
MEDQTRHRLARLDELKAHLGLDSDTELAALLGRAPSQVSAWRKSRKPIREVLARSLEAEAQLPPGWLDLAPGQGLEHCKSAHHVGEAHPHYGGVTRLPAAVTTSHTQFVSVTWGKLSDMLDGHLLPTEFLQSFATASAASYFVQLHDNSNAPGFRPGDSVLLDPNATPGGGDMVLVQTNTGELLLRQYSPRTAGRFDAVALNAVYPPLNSEADHLTVLARVMEHRRYL